MSTVSKSQLLEELAQAVPREILIDSEEALHPFECDGLSVYRQLPLLAALPENTRQVREILRCCRRLGVPVVTRGAGTGLSGGALPFAGGLLLVLTRLNRILELDVAARTVRVEPGVRNLAVSEAAAPHGLYYAPDPSSQIACSIGGNVAENAGGVHCLKYGLTTHNILALQVLTVDGELITVGGAALDSPGLDLMAVLTGSEGLLGIVVEVTVRLLPLLQLARVVMAGFPTVRADCIGERLHAGADSLRQKPGEEQEELRLREEREPDDETDDRPGLAHDPLRISVAVVPAHVVDHVRHHVHHPAGGVPVDADGVERAGDPRQRMALTDKRRPNAQAQALVLDVGDGQLSPVPRPLAALMVYLESIQR